MSRNSLRVSSQRAFPTVLATEEGRIISTLLLIPGAFARYFQWGLHSASQLETEGARAVFGAMLDHYRDSGLTDSPPPEPLLRMLLGERACWLNDFISGFPYAHEADQEAAWSVLVRMSTQRKLCNTLSQALSDATAGTLEAVDKHLENAKAQLLQARSGARANTGVELAGVEAIFAPLPELRWVSQGLMIAPGRPTLVVAYGATGKTLALQSFALSVAAAKPIWDHFDVSGPLRVVHLDYEQGRRDTFRRYQRLMIGHGFHESDSCVRQDGVAVAIRVTVI